jgi:hypothetical protein
MLNSIMPDVLNIMASRCSCIRLYIEQKRESIDIDRSIYDKVYDDLDKEVNLAILELTKVSTDNFCSEISCLYSGNTCRTIIQITLYFY